MRKPELLAPAGNMEKLQVALNYGADAVYVGGKQFSLRAQAGNFDLDDLAEAVSYTHGQGKKLYVALNIFAHNTDLVTLPAYLKALTELAPDALIVSDLGVFSLARQHAPHIPLHISTQANTVNWQSARVWRELGASRVILGRELMLSEAAQISAQARIDTELFVHGAMCMSYSGRCLLSNFLTGRDANRGDCTQPCRWQYALVEQKRPGQYLPVEEDERGSYIMNSKDLCLLAYLPQVLATGVSALKIEGRNKSAYYVANVVRVYRQAVDEAWRAGESYQVQPQWLAELAKVSHREYTTGFALGALDETAQRYQTGDPLRGYDFVATVQAVAAGWLHLQQRNHIAVGDQLEILLPDGQNQACPVTELFDAAGQAVTAVPHPCQCFSLPISQTLQDQLVEQKLPLIVRRPIR